ncbi:MAG: hypothetical protein AAFW98_20520, partial [Pseudomonadota bacterium]
GGVGYFEYEATVDGDQTLQFDVRLDQVDDVLKSLVVFDGAGGVGSVSLPGRAGLADLFRDLPFDGSALQSPATLLRALTGSEVTIEGPSRVSGRILSVVPEVLQLEDGTTITRHRLTVMGEDNASDDSAAVRFVMHLLSDDELVPYAVGQSVLPATKSGQASEAVQSDQYLADWAAAAISPRRNTVASLDNASEVAAIIGEEVQASILGQKTPQEAADSMQARLEDAIR